MILLIVLYAAAHVFMSHTRLGRYIYAVGGNEEAARLSGVPVKFVIVFVYIVSALCAGLGGCIQAIPLDGYQRDGWSGRSFHAKTKAALDDLVINVRQAAQASHLPLITIRSGDVGG